MNGVNDWHARGLHLAHIMGTEMMLGTRWRRSWYPMALAGTALVLDGSQWHSTGASWHSMALNASLEHAMALTGAAMICLMALNGTAMVFDDTQWCAG
eukprot:1153303-Pelagomonas_calceolata.AAC.8